MLAVLTGVFSNMVAMETDVFFKENYHKNIIFQYFKINVCYFCVFWSNEYITWMLDIKNNYYYYFFIVLTNWLPWKFHFYKKSSPTTFFYFFFSFLNLPLNSTMGIKRLKLSMKELLCNLYLFAEHVCFFIHFFHVRTFKMAVLCWKMYKWKKYIIIT